MIQDVQTSVLMTGKENAHSSGTVGHMLYTQFLNPPRPARPPTHPPSLAKPPDPRRSLCLCLARARMATSAVYGMMRMVRIMIMIIRIFYLLS